MAWQYAVAAGLPVLGGVIGNLAGKGDRERARKAQEEAYAQFDGVGLPGAYQPLDGSAMEGVAPDELGVQAQRAALRRLQEIGLGGGLTAEDRGQLADIQQTNAQAANAAGAGIMADARARGMAGSNMAYSQALQAQQAGQNRASRQGMEVAAMAQRRALQALQAQGALAGQLRGQSFDEGASKAGAADAIARFNASMAQQSAMDRYRAQLGLAEAKAGALQGKAGMYRQAGDEKAAFWSGLGDQLGSGAAKGYGAYRQDQRDSEEDEREERRLRMLEEYYGRGGA